MIDMRYPAVETNRLALVPPRYRDVRESVAEIRHLLRRNKQERCSLMLWNDRVGWGVTDKPSLSFTPHESCRVALHADSPLDDVTAALLLGMRESNNDKP